MGHAVIQNFHHLKVPYLYPVMLIAVASQHFDRDTPWGPVGYRPLPLVIAPPHVHQPYHQYSENAATQEYILH